MMIKDLQLHLYQRSPYHHTDIDCPISPRYICLCPLYWGSSVRGLNGRHQGRVQESLTLANVSLKYMCFRLTFANVLLIEHSPSVHVWLRVVSRAHTTHQGTSGKFRSTSAAITHMAPGHTYRYTCILYQTHIGNY